MPRRERTFFEALIMGLAAQLIVYLGTKDSNLAQTAGIVVAMLA